LALVALLWELKQLATMVLTPLWACQPELLLQLAAAVVLDLLQPRHLQVPVVDQVAAVVAMQPEVVFQTAVLGMPVLLGKAMQVAITDQIINQAVVEEEQVPLDQTPALLVVPAVPDWLIVYLVPVYFMLAEAVAAQAAQVVPVVPALAEMVLILLEQQTLL
jgi:hypothetical protein